jgi:predicted ATPase
MITSLRLVNFKCFKDQSFALRPLTVLSGLNGTGKSSVIQSLLLLRQSYEQKLLPDKGLALNGSFVGLGTANDVLCRSAVDDSVAIELVLDVDELAKWRFAKAKDLASDVLAIRETETPVKIVTSSLLDRGFQYLSAERLGPRASFMMAEYVVRQQRQLGSRGEYTAHFLSVFGPEEITLDGAKHPNASSGSLTGQVEAWLGEVSPGVRLEITPHTSMDVVNMQFSFVEGRFVSDGYRPTNVGFGLTYTLPIIVGALGAVEDGLLLFENPEAHLHAKGQVKLAELFARVAASGVQIIIETHSEHILNGVRIAVHQGIIPAELVQLHYFERRETGVGLRHVVNSPNLDSDGRIDFWPDGFFDEWDRSLESLLGPKPKE